MPPNRSCQVNLIIVIVSYKAKAYLRRCLLSLIENPPRVGYRVMVVENASKDGTASLVRSDFPKVLLLEEEKNLGFAKACNRILRFPPTEYILFLNPDVAPEKGAIDQMISLLDKRGEIGIVGGALWGFDGRLQPSYRQFPTYRNLLSTKRSILGRLLGKGLKLRGDEGEVDSVAGGFMMVRGRLFHRLRGFDERFFMYVEDVDLCYRAREVGKKVFYLSQARAKHFWGGSTKLCKKRMEIEHHKSLYRFFEKHYLHPFKNLILLWILLFNLGLTLVGEILEETFSIGRKRATWLNL